MTDDVDLARKAAARFFLRVEQVGTRWEDRHTLPLFPLLLVTTPDMMDADADYEGRRFSVPSTGPGEEKT